MTMLSTLAIGAGVLHLLGWSLLHFLWQAALLALVLGAVLIGTRNRTPRTRYALCCAALALMALCPIVTFAYLAYTAGDAPHAGLVAATAHSGSLARPQEWQTASASLFERAAAIADQAMPWILAFWIAGVLFLLGRAIVAGMAAQKLKTSAIVTAPENLLALAMHVGQRLGITQAFKVFASQAVTAPTVVGWLKPVILFPVASLAGLAPEQLEAMLAHELAHIRRHDYLVNALQVAMETLLFYHPAVWWVSQQIRREREHCCDDIAVAATGSPLVYAKALYLLEEQRSMAPQLTLGGNGGQLMMRIQRLLTGKQSATGSYGGTSWLLTVTLLFVTAGLAVSTATIGKARAQSPAPPAATETPAAGREIPWGEAVKHVQYRTPPQYPEIAKAAHVSGEVRIAITIGPKGEVEAAHVVSGPAMLRQAALDSAIHWKFSPFSDQPATTTVAIIFSLADGDAGKDDAKPDLSCTYYDNRNAGHAGTCELHETDAQKYFCRQNDEDKQTQLQVGCQQKIETLQAWESRKANP
jgi:bla regulator protein blaR1